MLFIVRDYVVLLIDEGMSMEHCWHDSDTEKLKYSEKTYPSATLWTTTGVLLTGDQIWASAVWAWQIMSQSSTV